MHNADVETFCPSSKNDWRKWLQKNHSLKQSVWLIYYKKKTGVPSITWSEAVDEALCFGWIDSLAKPIDDEKYMQFFSRRKPSSVWSKINKDKVKRLIENGLMAAAGFTTIEIAKQNGSWIILDAVEAMIIPKDLAIAFKNKPGSKKFFLSLSKSVQKNILQWVVLAKLPETREKRIVEIATLASQQMKPKQF